MDVSYDLLLISVCTRGVETFEPPLYLAQKVPADRIRRGAFVCQTTSFSLSPFASWQIEQSGAKGECNIMTECGASM